MNMLKSQFRLRERFNGNKGLAQTYFENIDATHRSQAYKDKNEESLMIRKNYEALGSFDKNDDRKLWTFL